MAIGDVKADVQAIAISGGLTIQPPVGEEWVIHNIYYTQGITIRLVRGANVIQFDSDSSAGARQNLTIHLTNSQYLQVNNTFSGTNNIGYDGVQTK